MAKKITVWQSTDGTHYDTEQEALCQDAKMSLASVLNPVTCSTTTSVQIIDALAGKRDLIISYLSHLVTEERNNTVAYTALDENFEGHLTVLICNLILKKAASLPEECTNEYLVNEFAQTLNKLLS